MSSHLLLAAEIVYKEVVRMNKLTRVAFAIVAGGALAIGGVIPAGAASAPPMQFSADCVAQVAAIEAEVSAAVDTDVCSLKTGSVALGTAEIATAAIIKADPSLSANQKRELLATAAAGSVKTKTYSQFTTGGTYTVTQNGRFYYDGAKVWVGTTYRGVQGTHSCFVNYSVAVSLANDYCSESGTTTTRYMKYGWTVTLLVKGFPVAYGYSMTANLYSNGTASGFGTTTG
jgi:hypothetical protein